MDISKDTSFLSSACDITADLLTILLRVVELLFLLFLRRL